MIREAVGVFESPEALNAAVVELETTAFPRDAISVLGNAETLKKKFGIPYMRPEDAEDNPEAPRDILVRPEEKTIVISAVVAIAIYAAITGAALMLGPAPSGAGLAIMAVIAVATVSVALFVTKKLLAQRRKDSEEQRNAGGTVLWVRTAEPEQEDMARDILCRHGAKDVHIHMIN